MLPDPSVLQASCLLARKPLEYLLLRSVQILNDRLRIENADSKISQRHKQEVLTPSLHAETYSPDSNRYDLLPFLRPPLTWAYNKIERAVSEAEQRR